MSSTAPRTHDESSDTAYSVSIFAGVMLATLAAFEILQGFSAVLKDDVFVGGIDYVYEIDVTAWGWWHVLIGVVGLAVGIGILQRQVVGLLRRHRLRGVVGPGPVRLPALLPLLVDADHRPGRPGDLGPGEADRPSLSRVGSEGGCPAIRHRLGAWPACSTASPSPPRSSGSGP